MLFMWLFFGGGREDLLAESRVGLDAFHGFLRRGLMRLFFAIADAIGGEDATKQNGGLEHRVVLCVVISVD